LHRSITLQVAEKFLREGKMGAVAYLGLVTTQSVTICGIDDQCSYEAARDRYFNNLPEYFDLIVKRKSVLFGNFLTRMKADGATIVAVTLSDYNYSHFADRLKSMGISHAGIRSSSVGAEPNRPRSKAYRSHRESLASKYDSSGSIGLFHSDDGECLKALNRRDSAFFEASTDLALESISRRSQMGAQTLHAENARVENRPILESADTAGAPPRLQSELTKDVALRGLRRICGVELHTRTWGQRLLWLLLLVGSGALSGSACELLGLWSWFAYSIGLLASPFMCFCASRCTYGVRYSPIASSVLFVLAILLCLQRTLTLGSTTGIGVILDLVQWTCLLAITLSLQRGKSCVLVGIVGLIVLSGLHGLWHSPVAWFLSESDQVILPVILITSIGTAVALQSKSPSWLDCYAGIIATAAFLGAWFPGTVRFAHASMFVTSVSFLVFLFSASIQRAITMPFEVAWIDWITIRRCSGKYVRHVRRGDLTIWTDADNQVVGEIASVICECQTRLRNMTGLSASGEPRRLIVFSTSSAYLKYSYRVRRRLVLEPSYVTGWIRKRIVLCTEGVNRDTPDWKASLAQVVSWRLVSNAAKHVPFWTQLGLARCVAAYWAPSSCTIDSRSLQVYLGKGELFSGDELLAVSGSAFARCQENWCDKHCFALQSASFVQCLLERYPEKFKRFLYKDYKLEVPSWVEHSEDGTQTVYHFPFLGTVLRAYDQRVFACCFGLSANRATIVWVDYMSRHRH
jgi:hypothetical protein